MAQKERNPEAVLSNPQAAEIIEQQQEAIEQRFWQSVERIRAQRR